MKVFGAINCGLKDRRYYYYLDGWKHTANVHVSLLYMILREQLETAKYRPTELYVQLDNCGKDNKNKCV